MIYNRGDVYLAQDIGMQGSEIKKTRPWVLVGANPLNKARKTVVALPLTTQVKEIPQLSIKILFNNITCCVVLDQIRAIDKSRLLRHEGNLSKYEMDLIDNGLRVTLSL